MALERLDKLIANSGKASRKEAKALIKGGRVSVDGQIASSAEDKYDESGACICIDGEVINCSNYRYILMNKPNGVLSATEDTSQQTVIDLLPKELQKLDLAPVGRLDKDTTGLLLLTSDGDYLHRVISPKHHVAKVYRAAVDGILDQSDIEAFEAGIVLADGTRCLPGKLVIERPSVALVTVYEGKYHQVKRMLASRGKPVTALKRLSVGGLTLPEGLGYGEYVELDKAGAMSVFE